MYSTHYNDIMLLSISERMVSQMCGIVGYIGNDKASDIILSGLEKLEYRGYDSCGIFLYDTLNAKYVTYKDKGRISHLENDFSYEFENHLGIGHTRWATHGKPNQQNSHPHFSASKRFGIVHNGVIENYRELMAKYLDGVVFLSETDTEVIINMVEYFVSQMTVEEAIRKTLSLLEGSYAMLIIDKLEPDTLYAAKNKSPLIIGPGHDGITIASDVMALVGYADTYMPIEDKNFVRIDKTPCCYTYQITDIIGKPVELPVFKMDIVLEEIGKAGYPHYMLKEICEEPSVIRKIIGRYLKEGNVSLPENALALFKKAKRIHILAAGTSYHAGFVGKYYFEHMAGIPTEVFVASEYAYNQPLIVDDPLFLFISQSGETADLRVCLQNIKSRGYKAVVLTNVPTSTLARESDASIEINAGPEIAVASTKAYVGQVAILAIIAYALASKKPFDLVNEMSRVAIAMDAVIDGREYIQKIVGEKLNKRNCFYIGKGLDYYTCLEAALKLKEISYIQTEGFAAGELKHGTIALIEDGVPVFAIISQKSIQNNTRASVHEVEARGANVITIVMNDVSDSKDDIILMDVEEMLAPLVTVIPTQLIAYYSALNLGRDIDKPRNLAKSVTVE